MAEAIEHISDISIEDMDWWVTTTIKWSWLELILSGEKKVEYKVVKPFWETRLDKLLDTDISIGINFICKKKSFKFEVISIIKQKSDRARDIDGVLTNEWYEIHLGDRLK